MTKEAEWLNRQKDVIMAGTKNMFSEIGPIFKSPVSTAKRLASSNKAIIGIELIVAKAVICLIVMIIAMFVFQGKLEDLAFGAEVEMPWLKTIITVILMTAGVDFLEALIMKLITGAFNGRTHFTAMVNVIGERAIFDTIIFVIYMILMLLSFKVSLGFNMLFSSITVFIQFSAYRGCVSMNEDRKPYAYFIAKFCVAIISALVVYLIFKDTIDAFLKIMDTAEGFLNGSFF